MKNLDAKSVVVGVVAGVIIVKFVLPRVAPATAAKLG